MLPFAQITGPYLNLLLAGVGGLVLLSIGVISFFVIYQRRIFEQERGRAEQARLHQRQLLAAAVDVQEAERRRIASDLHDDIGSLLTATRLYLRQIKPAQTDGRNDEIKRQSLCIVDEMISNTRRISHDLLPPTLEKFGLRAAAEDLCERINQAGGPRVRFRSNLDERIDRRTELGLFRALQELLNNTLKHAEAENVDVALHAGPQSLRFTYRDDGKGFSPAQAGGGLGLRSIESRANLLNATLALDSAPGRGLSVGITVPSYQLAAA